MKKFASLMLALLMLLALTACGGGGEEASEDPNLGKYMGDKINILGWTDMSEVYAGENYIELKSGGKGEFCLDGEPLKVKWTLEGEAFVMEAEDQQCTGTLKDGAITVESFFGIDMPMTFLKDGVQPVAEASGEEAAPAEGAAEEAAAEAPASDVLSSDFATAVESDGVIELEVLKEGFNWLYNSTGAEGGHQRPTYQEVREHFGGKDGMKSNESSWESGWPCYKWLTADGSEFALISFKLQEDGSQTWNSSNWSDGLKN